MKCSEYKVSQALAKEFIEDAEVARMMKNGSMYGK